MPSIFYETPKRSLISIDMMRAYNLYKFFANNEIGSTFLPVDVRAHPDRETDIHYKSLTLSIAMVYHL